MGAQGGAESSSSRTTALVPEDLSSAWQNALAGIGGLLGENARNATVQWRDASDGRAAPEQVVATFTRQYNFGKQFCERAENLASLQRALSEALGRPVRLVLATSDTSSSAQAPHVELRKPAQSRQRLQGKSEHPWVKRATELFDARVVWMEEPKIES
jgi:hypothetical protein